MIVVSIDPGKLNLPVCAWRDGRLIGACLSVLDPKVHGRLRADQIALEHMRSLQWLRSLAQTDSLQIFVEQMQLNTGRDTTRGQAIAKGNDLLNITQIAGTVASALGGHLRHVPIGTWKGSAPKEVTKARVLKTLTPAELVILETALKGVKKSLHHNLFDAAGIGLHATGRYVVRR